MNDDQNTTSTAELLSEAGSVNMVDQIANLLSGEPEKPAATKKKPIEKPIATTEPTTTDVTPQTPEKLPQPKPKTKPTPVEKPVAVEPAKTIEPIEPTDTAVKPQAPEKLPQPKLKTKPIVNPEVKPVANTEKDIEDKNLQESILKIKRLMFS
jgi:hypothetical protein